MHTGTEHVHSTAEVKALRAPARSENFFVRHWRGHVSLSRALALNGIVALLVPALLSLPVSSPPATLREQPGAVRVLAGLWVATIALRLALQVWWNVGVWRSATFHIARGGKPLSASAAKMFVVAAVMVQVCALVYIARSPQIVVLQILLGRDPHGQANLQLSPNGEILLVSGELGSGFAAALTQALQHAPSVKTLQLSSHGGRLYEAIAAAKEIRARKLDTRVEDHCNSGCTILFLAGHDRTIASAASLGFHKPLLGTLDGTASDVEVELGAMKNLGAPDAFLARIRALSDRKVWFPTADELFQLRVITVPVTRGDAW